MLSCSSQVSYFCSGCCWPIVDIAVGDDLIDLRGVQAGNAGEQRPRRLVDVEPAGIVGDGVHGQILHQLRQIRLHRAWVVRERRIDDDAAAVVAAASPHSAATPLPSFAANLGCVAGACPAVRFQLPPAYLAMTRRHFRCLRFAPSLAIRVLTPIKSRIVVSRTLPCCLRSTFTLETGLPASLPSYGAALAIGDDEIGLVLGEDLEQLLVQALRGCPC